jgi:hypothetical protein
VDVTFVALIHECPTTSHKVASLPPNILSLMHPFWSSHGFRAGCVASKPATRSIEVAICNAYLPDCYALLWQYLAIFISPAIALAGTPHSVAKDLLISLTG